MRIRKSFPGLKKDVLQVYSLIMENKERLNIIAGHTVEPIWSNEGGELYTVISTKARMKTPNNEWIDAIIYCSNRDGLGGSWKVMDKVSFYERFKVFGEVIEEDSNG